MSGNKLEEVIKIIIVVMQNSSLSIDLTISMNTSLRGDLGFDSIALAELAVRIEDLYNVDVFEDGLVSTVKEIIEKL